MENNAFVVICAVCGHRDGEHRVIDRACPPESCGKFKPVFMDDWNRRPQTYFEPLTAPAERSEMEE